MNPRKVMVYALIAGLVVVAAFLAGTSYMIPDPAMQPRQ